MRKELDILAWPQKYIIKSSEKNYRQSSFVKTYCMEEPIGFIFRDCWLLCNSVGRIPTGCRGFESHHSNEIWWRKGRRIRRCNLLTTIPTWFETDFLLVKGVLGSNPNPDLIFIYVTVPIAEMLYIYEAVAVSVNDSGCRPYIDRSVQSTLSQ